MSGSTDDLSKKKKKKESRPGVELSISLVDDFKNKKNEVESLQSIHFCIVREMVANRKPFVLAASRKSK